MNAGYVVRVLLKLSRVRLAYLYQVWGGFGKWYAMRTLHDFVGRTLLGPIRQ